MESYVAGAGTRLVPLSRGYAAVVDVGDFRRVMKIKWHALIAGNKVYGQGRVRRDGSTVRTLLHRFIVQAPEGLEIDHADGDGLNNRRGNLRHATHAQNIQNGGTRGGSSTFKGVSYDRKNRKWAARIGAAGKSFYLGLHASEEDAARAYDAKAKELHGEFARLNFPT